MPPSLSPLEFFLDRSLGGHRVAEALRGAGWIIRTHAEVYAERDENVEDVEWLERCGRERWVALTMDRRIRYRPVEIEALRLHRVRAFALTSGNLTAADQAARFIHNGGRIVNACVQPGPVLYTVHATKIVRVFP